MKQASDTTTQACLPLHSFKFRVSVSSPPSSYTPLVLRGCGSGFEAAVRAFDHQTRGLWLRVANTCRSPAFGALSPRDVAASCAANNSAET